ncbi:MAG: 5,10-methylenetetrahydrofolate reductase [Actinomycetales bacterium]|nr:5,10-methylenetetrahydrofolate reductase [Actinomycetales bacterium]
MPSAAWRTVFRNADSGVLCYGITPPRRHTTAERAAEIADTTLARLRPLDLDALVLYDIDDESDRNPAVERPFPYLPTLDPVVFHREHLGDWRRPLVVYRCVGKYHATDLGAWMRSADVGQVMTVLVGSSSAGKAVLTGLDEAYTLRQRVRPQLPLGGVVIAERHERRADEHLRMLTKSGRGCSFFVSQIFYDLDCTKNLLSDYAYACRDRGVAPVPVVLSTSVCGSARTLEFMTWLGISVPRWLRNAIVNADDPLAESFAHCLAGARDMIAFCRRLGLPFGINVESVSIRRVEIEASVELAREISGLLGRR